jgi:hypothetical protein
VVECAAEEAEDRGAEEDGAHSVVLPRHGAVRLGERGRERAEEEEEQQRGVQVAVDVHFVTGGSVSRRGGRGMTGVTCLVVEAWRARQRRIIRQEQNDAQSNADMTQPHQLYSSLRSIMRVWAPRENTSALHPRCKGHCAAHRLYPRTMYSLSLRHSASSDHEMVRDSGLGLADVVGAPLGRMSATRSSGTCRERRAGSDMICESSVGAMGHVGNSGWGVKSRQAVSLVPPAYYLQIIM